MKLTFPHMGNMYITVKSLLDDLEVDYAIPPFNNKTALEMGAKYAPEMACLPLKINIGNFIQAASQGADTILMAGGCGPCRFGYYCEMHREILKDIGLNMDIITLEMPNEGFMELVRRVGKLAGGFKPIKIVKALKNAVEISLMTDEIERLCFKLRPREVIRGGVDKIYKNFRNNALIIKGSGEIKKLVKNTILSLGNIETDPHVKPFKIGIVGEIYTTIDTHTSFDIQEKLGGMGAEVSREVTVGGWITEHIIKGSLHLRRDMRYAEAAKPYLPVMIGGHAQETLGNTVLYAKTGFDGIIQIYPLTCMPEIVAESILPTIENDYGIPVLTLIIDEMTGEAGYLTRVEAFMDLLEKRGERSVLEGNRVFSWN